MTARPEREDPHRPAKQPDWRTMISQAPGAWAHLVGEWHREAQRHRLHGAWWRTEYALDLGWPWAAWDEGGELLGIVAVEPGVVTWTEAVPGRAYRLRRCLPWVQLPERLGGRELATALGRPWSYSSPVRAPAPVNIDGEVGGEPPMAPGHHDGW